MPPRTVGCVQLRFDPALADGTCSFTYWPDGLSADKPWTVRGRADVDGVGLFDSITQIHIETAEISAEISSEVYIDLRKKFLTYGQINLHCMLSLLRFNTYIVSSKLTSGYIYCRSYDRMEI